MAPEPFGPGDLRGVPAGDLVRAEFEEPGVGVVHERDVEAVDPGHGRVAGVVVAVERPARREQEVAAAHGHRVPVHDGPHALALDHEPEGVLGVPVLGRGLVRAQVLDGGPQRRRGVGPPAQARVGQGDRAALPAPAHRDQVTGPFGQRLQRRPAPHVRPRGRGRLGRHEVFALGPQRDQVLGAEVVVQLPELARVLARRAFPAAGRWPAVLGGGHAGPPSQTGMRHMLGTCSRQRSRILL